MARFTVTPAALDFQPLNPTGANVAVKNTGFVPMTVLQPVIGGLDKNRFAATAVDCAGSVDPGRSCQIKVTFMSAPGTFSATLVVQVIGAPQAIEVPIQAKAIL